MAATLLPALPCLHECRCRRYRRWNVTPADVKTYAEFIREFVAAAQAAKKSGKTVDDFVASWKTPERFAGYAAPQAARVKADATVIFNETK